MEFEQSYQEIKYLVKDDLSFLETEIVSLFENKNPLSKDLLGFLRAPAKRIRPVLAFLFLKNLFGELNQKQYDVLLAVELIHNATLIHDDIIDKSEKRRDQKTLNIKFDDNLAVVAGDFLLSVAMERIINTGSLEVIKVCTLALKSTCLGEISQYFSKFTITSIDDYIKKSKEKTALLFEIAVLGGVLLSEKYDENLLKTASEFSQNFGVAFQVRDDLINVLNAHNNVLNNDIKSGVYTAPLIFAYQENKNVLQSENILESIKDTKGIEKTKDLMENYFDKSISTIEKLENNVYKQGILKLVEILKTNL